MNRLKELRKNKNVSLAEVGKAVGVATNTISRYENGKREPKLEMWQKLANYFGVSVPYLQGIDEKPYSKEVYEVVADHLKSSAHHGYSKDHIFNLLYEAYKDDYEASYDEEPFTPVELSTRQVVDEYLVKHRIKPPKEFTLDFFKTNFAWLLDRKNVKRLLTTKDKYSDDDIKDILLENLVFSDSLLELVNRIYGKQERN